MIDFFPFLDLFFFRSVRALRSSHCRVAVGLIDGTVFNGNIE